MIKLSISMAFVMVLYEVSSFPDALVYVTKYSVAFGTASKRILTALFPEII
nr:hypothetical protein [Algibacter lectus]